MVFYKGTGQIDEESFQQMVLEQLQVICTNKTKQVRYSPYTFQKQFQLTIYQKDKKIKFLEGNKRKLHDIGDEVLRNKTERMIHEKNDKLNCIRIKISAL